MSRDLGMASGDAWKAVGCQDCRVSGYLGRLEVLEAFDVSEEIRELVNARAPADDIRDRALVQGMKTLRENALAKAEAGLTSLEEVLRVT